MHFLKKNKTALILSAGAGATILIAMNLKKAINENAFSTAINKSLEEEYDLCLEGITWPAEVNETELRLQDAIPTSTAGRFAALEAAGLARGQDIEVPGMGFDGKQTGVPFKLKRYTLTIAAIPFERSSKVEQDDQGESIANYQTRLCWGKKVVNEITGLNVTPNNNERDVIDIQYTYKIDHIASWATDPRILISFPNISKVISGAYRNKEHRRLKLTESGWQAANT